MTLIDWLTFVLLLTIAISFAAGLLAWRERPEPGATPLVLLLGGEVWWSAFLVFELQATAIDQKILWSNIQWVGVVLIPVAWLLFSLEYTGRDRYVRRHIVTALLVIPLITIILAAIEPYHTFLYVETTTVTHGGVTFLERTPAIWFWVIAGYTYLLGGLGIVPMVQLLLQTNTMTFRGQSTALIIGLITPWATNLLFVLGNVPIEEFDPTPIAFAVAGIAYLGALTRFRLFGTSPAPNRRARRVVFEQMEDGALVIDSNNYVVDLNDRAEWIIGDNREMAVGSPLEDLLPELVPIKTSAVSSYIAVDTPAGERHYDITVSNIHDIHDRLIGRVITFHDIGEFLRQQQRLAVLNRVFRHNIRTNTQVIVGYAEQLTDGHIEPERDEGHRPARVLKDQAQEIANLGEKARAIIDLFEQEQNPENPIPLGPLLRENARNVRDSFPDVTIHLPEIREEYLVSNVVDPVVWNILENAVEHNTSEEPQITVEFEPVSDWARISIADNGPGLGEHEYSVLEEGTETSLEHASGLGLWLIYWGTDIAGGQVSFEENDPTGTIVRIEVPLLEPT